MSRAANEADVRDQLSAAGLILKNNHLEIDTPHFVRCKVEGEDSEARGWYKLHEMPTDNGQTLIVGQYGVWIGNENNAQKITLSKALDDSLSAEQKAQIKKSHAEAKKREEHEQQAKRDKLAAKAQAAWRALSTEGQSPYLQKKASSRSG